MKYNFLKKHLLFALVLTFLVLLMLFANMRGILNNCFNAFDFGLYQQAIYNIAAGNDLFNPFLTVRGVGIFNDHFTPAIYMAVPIVRLFSYHPVSLIIFEWFWFALFIVLAFRLKKLSIGTHPIRTQQAVYLLILSMIVLCKGLLSGMVFPIHPGTWSMPFWFLTVYFLQKNNFLGVTLSALALCFFKESFTFAIMGLSLFYLFNREWKKFIVIFVIAAFFIIFAFVLREKIYGPVVDYGGHVVRNLLTNPISYLTERFIAFDLKGFAKIYYPFVIPFVIFFQLNKNIFKSFKKLTSHYVFGVFLMMGPLFLLHFLTNKFHYQYGPALVTPFLGIVILSSVPERIVKSSKLTFFTILLFILSSSSIHTKFVKLAFANKTRHCNLSSDKSPSTQKIIELVGLVPTEKTILSTAGVIPRVMRPGLKITPPKAWAKLSDKYDYLLLEKNSSGDVYPVTPAEVEKIRKQCMEAAGPNSEILIDDAYYFFMRGDNVNKGCFDVF